MPEPKPNQPVRRFDVFAEYQRLKALQESQSPEQAKGYGIWLAKVVAARRFGKSRTSEAKPGAQRSARQTGAEDLVDDKWRALDGVAQTDVLFDKEIIQRMGMQFYDQVFAPHIAEAFAAGKDYTEIRDSIRKDWKPGA